MNTRFQKLVISTGDGLYFTQLVASPLLRGLALWVDFLVTQVLIQILVLSLTLFAFVSMDFYFTLYILGTFVITLGYGILLEWLWRGQTLGKRLFRLRVVDATGLKLMLSQVVLRNLLRPVDAFPILYLLGGIVCWFSPRGQRLGDITAGTAVIRAPQIREPNYQTLDIGKYNSFREFPHIASRLRQRVEPEEAALLLEALNRRERLTPEARITLYRDMVKSLKVRCAFPESATRGLSDEQYLRNCLELIYQVRK